jgi:hypothetical protein
MKMLNRKNAADFMARLVKLVFGLENELSVVERRGLSFRQFVLRNPTNLISTETQDFY